MIVNVSMDLIVTGDEKSPLNWIYSKLHTEHKYGAKPKDLRGYKHKVDDTISYCPSCNRCYNIEYPEKNLQYFDNFPKIGKKKKRCKHCINLNR